MVYNIEWLDEARQSLDAEMEYAFAEFRLKTLSKVYDNLMERVTQLEIFLALACVVKISTIEATRFECFM